ncbi:conserved hypothetical protein, partial [Perkinsus marinus ATCC 50983]
YTTDAIDDDDDEDDDRDDTMSAGECDQEPEGMQQEEDEQEDEVVSMRRSATESEQESEQDSDPESEMGGCDMNAVEGFELGDTEEKSRDGRLISPRRAVGYPGSDRALVPGMDWYANLMELAVFYVRRDGLETISLALREISEALPDMFPTSGANKTPVNDR